VVARHRYSFSAIGHPDSSPAPGALNRAASSTTFNYSLISLSPRAENKKMSRGFRHDNDYLREYGFPAARRHPRRQMLRVSFLFTAPSLRYNV